MHCNTIQAQSPDLLPDRARVSDTCERQRSAARDSADGIAGGLPRTHGSGAPHIWVVLFDLNLLYRYSGPHDMHNISRSGRAHVEQVHGCEPDA
eukprot:5970518-Prymnesium_polylepis.1